MIHLLFDFGILFIFCIYFRQGNTAVIDFHPYLIQGFFHIRVFPVCLLRGKIYRTAMPCFFTPTAAEHPPQIEFREVYALSKNIQIAVYEIILPGVKEDFTFIVFSFFLAHQLSDQSSVFLVGQDHRCRVTHFSVNMPDVDILSIFVLQTVESVEQPDRIRLFSCFQISHSGAGPILFVIGFWIIFIQRVFQFIGVIGRQDRIKRNLKQVFQQWVIKIFEIIIKELDITSPAFLIIFIRCNRGANGIIKAFDLIKNRIILREPEDRVIPGRVFTCAAVQAVAYQKNCRPAF